METPVPYSVAHKPHLQRPCAACGGVGSHHVTLTLNIAHAAKKPRTKIIQFWLCDGCELNSQSYLMRNADQSGRIARALTPDKADWLYPKPVEEVVNALV